MEFETYADVIDAYNADNMGYSSLTDYIKDQNIKIKEIEMDPIGDMRRIFESKADGGSIGIEVLFKEKMANGGRVPMVSGGALKAIGSGIMKLFSKGDDAVDLAKQEEIFRSGNITTDFLENVDPKVTEKFIRTRDMKGPGGYGMYKSFDDMPNGLKAAELISRIKTADGGINYEAAELFIGKKLKGDETVDELISMVITEKKADGGRVGLFMGGPALEGQALNIYNSMNSYGFSDQEIANALQGQGLYTPPGSSTPETTAPNIIGSQLKQGGGDNNFGGQGIGAFGNLDPNTEKMMQVEMADGMGGVTIKEVPTYLDAGGLRKTLDNKNPVNLGLDIKPMAFGIIESLISKKTDSEFDPKGKIYGTFNNPNYKDLSFFGKIKADALRQKELKQLQKEFELQEQLKKQIAAQEAAKAAEVAATGNYTPGASNLTRGPSGGGLGLTQSQAQSVSQANKDAGYASFGGLKDGGLATMFTRRR